jgi:hypothetical protein
VSDQKCAGVSLRGYRVGEPCGAVPKFAVRGKLYCHSHYVTAVKEPKRFREAVEAFVRGEARREMQRRAAARQVDAFPEVDAPMSGEAAAVYDPADTCCEGCKTGTSDCDVNPMRPREVL